MIKTGVLKKTDNVTVFRGFLNSKIIFDKFLWFFTRIKTYQYPENKNRQKTYKKMTKAYLVL